MTSALEQEFANSPTPEKTLLGHLAACDFQPPATKSRGGQLRLMLAGYSGSGNVGTEMRTGEIRRQIAALLGPQVSFRALSTTGSLPEDTLPQVQCVKLDGYLPQALQEAVDEVDAVVACEGSMFKSTFSNVLSAIMATAIGGAHRVGKLSVGYGAEIGRMDPMLEGFVREQVGQALILCRNEPSLRRAQELGLRAQLGADTAWSFDAAPPDESRVALSSLGWDGVSPLLVVCPINAFWWPVRPFPAMRVTESNRHLHYQSIFFHAHSAARQAAYRRYMEQMASAINHLAERNRAFVLLVSMERVDRAACADLAARLTRPAGQMQGADHPVRTVIGVLRCASLLVSSRFHALVGAMPAGVPSVGVSMDERIVNLLGGDSERVVKASSLTLGQDILRAVEQLDPDQVAAASVACVREGLRLQAGMGRAFLEELRRAYPGLEIAEPSRPGDWKSWLPPLSPMLEAMA